MDNSQIASSKKEKNKKGIIYFLLIFLLLCSNALLGYLWWNERGKFQIITIEKENVSKDAEIVKQELIALQAQYETLKTNHSKLQKEIDAKKEEITHLQQELEKHKDNAFIIARLKRETETLRSIMQHFVHEIDSLNTLNKNVIAEKEIIKKELKSEKEKTIQLTKEKEELQNTVNIASMLKSVNLTAAAIMEKRGGKKEVETKKAKHTDKIKIKFTIAENPVATKGDKIIYARIITPDGKELTQNEDSTHIFSFGKSRGFWATKKTINYSNEETEVIMYAHPKSNEKFLHGKYIIEINTEGNTIGNSQLALE